MASLIGATPLAGLVGDLGGGCGDFTDVRASSDGQAEITQGLKRNC